MTTDPRRPAPPLNDPYNPGGSIRFEEPRKFPVALMAAVGGGVLAACAAAFFLLYKANTTPTDQPRPAQSRDGITATRPQDSAAAGVAEAPPKEGRIKGTVEDYDGKMVVTQPSKCVMLALNIENVKETMGPKPDADTLQWGQARIKQSQEQMAVLGCK